MEKDFEIRLAAKDDAAAILDIYAPYITDTTVTFECRVPSLEEFTLRVESTLKKFPYLVAVGKDGVILGYCYASPFRSRSAYDWDVETSIYVDMHHKHEGIGTALYQTIEKLLKLQNIVTMYACITSPNPVSERFHAGMGYQTAGIFKNSGYKFGKWRDICWMQKTINPYVTEPEPVIAFPEIDVTGILP